MRLSYYGYYLQHKFHHGRHLLDLTDFINSYAVCSDPKLKGSFTQNDELVYLHRLSGNACAIVMTRNAENFKKIDVSNMSIGEFAQLLAKDEKIGFASYLTVKPHFFGFASTSLSPKFDCFTNLVNHLLSITGNGSWNFCIHPLIHQATRDEAVNMTHIGKTTISVTNKNSLARDFFNVLSAGDNIDDIDGIDITIRPAKKKNIKSVVAKMMEKTSEDGVEKLVMKAKTDAQSALLDLYVVGKGVISDTISEHDETTISSIMDTKIRDNQKLKDQLDEFKQDGQIGQADFASILHFTSIDSWASLASDLQTSYKLRP